jgi:hypothetical protein
MTADALAAGKGHEILPEKRGKPERHLGFPPFQRVPRADELGAAKRYSHTKKRARRVALSM